MHVWSCHVVSDIYLILGVFTTLVHPNDSIFVSSSAPSSFLGDLVLHFNFRRPWPGRSLKRPGRTIGCYDCRYMVVVVISLAASCNSEPVFTDRTNVKQAHPLFFMKGRERTVFEEFRHVFREETDESDTSMMFVGGIGCLRRQERRRVDSPTG